MLQNPTQGAAASTAQPAAAATPQYEMVRHLLFGDRCSHGFQEPGFWRYPAEWRR